MIRSLLLLIASLYLTGQVLAQAGYTSSVIDFGQLFELRDRIENYRHLQVGVSQTPVDERGCAASYAISVVDDFRTVYRDGTTMPSTIPWVDTFLTQTGFAGNNQNLGSNNPTGAFMIEGYFEHGAPIFIDIYAGRPATENLETCYSLIGQDTNIACLNIANNIDEFISVEAIPVYNPASSKSHVILLVEAGPNNTSIEEAFGIGGIRVRAVYQAMTANEALSISYPRQGDELQFGARVRIEASANVCQLDIEWSADNGRTYEYIARDVDAGRFPYLWEVPSVATDSAFIRISRSGGGIIKKTGRFKIIPPQQGCRFVVLGGSAAAGVGPPRYDSGWVRRLEREMSLANTANFIREFAEQDYTTFQFLPDDAIIPIGINEIIDSSRNISNALTGMLPNAIILNFSNSDASKGYSTAQQLANYEQIISEAGNIPVYVTTPHPSELGSSILGQQLELRDSTLSRYGNRAIDFWSDFANSDGTIKSNLSADSGRHFNSRGHRWLYEKAIPTFVSGNPECFNLSSSTQLPRPMVDVLKMIISPNPTHKEFKLSLENQEGGQLTATLYDATGREVDLLLHDHRVATNAEIELQLEAIASGTYFLSLQLISDSGISSRGVKAVVVQ